MRYTRKSARTMAERLHNANVLPDGNLKSADLIDVVLMKLDNAADNDIPNET